MERHVELTEIDDDHIRIWHEGDFTVDDLITYSASFLKYISVRFRFGPEEILELFQKKFLDAKVTRKY